MLLFRNEKCFLHKASTDAWVVTDHVVKKFQERRRPHQTVETGS